MLLIYDSSIVGSNRFMALHRWAMDEFNKGNRSKASRINKVAERLKPDGYRFYPVPPKPPTNTNCM